jgi:hypothetical protein
VRLNVSRFWLPLTVAALLLVYWGQVVHAVKGESLTWDEGDHIFAGYESWKTHDFGLNPEHPPLVKMVATAPLLPLQLKAPPLQGRFFKTESYMDGRELLFRNGPANGGRYDGRSLVFRVRLAASIFGVLAGLLVFVATREMFSTEAALLALALFCFEPTLLAHGAYVTTDMGASCTIFATVYAFWRWVRRPTAARLLVAGAAAGIALATKHSAVLLAPMLVLLAMAALVWRWREVRVQGADKGMLRECAKMVGALVTITVVGVVVLWIFYGFRYSARPAGLALAPTLAQYVQPLAPREAHGILLAARLRLLPESWLYGLADVRLIANGTPSYFFGRVYEHGLWFYFPVLFVIKATLGMLGMLAVAAFAMLRGWVRRPLELAFVLLPAAVYMATAMSSHLNIGARHILPVFLFCCVLAGVGGMAAARRGRGWAITVGVLLVLHVASSVYAAPNYIPYSNEAWGGPAQTHRYLSDSNTDWAQQLIATAAALRKQHVQHCYIAYFAAPFILPSDYGVPCQRLPTFDSLSIDDRLSVPPAIDGPVLISAGDLNGFEFGSRVLNPYESFRELKPTRFIQDGIFWYDGRFAVPLASALLHVQLSADALQQHQVERAVQEAEQAERTAPGTVQTEMALGDAYAAAHRPTEAGAAYQRAGERIEAMEPEARTVWRATLAAKVAALH